MWQERPPEVLQAADALQCTSLLLINVTAPHPTRSPGNWLYIYDESMHATRITCTEMLSPHNAPAGHTGVQVEVYRPRGDRFEDRDAIAWEVLQELGTLGLIDDPKDPEVTLHTHWVPWANVICDHARRPALSCILGWLQEWGLVREPDDLHPMTDWDTHQPAPLGPVILAGRFGQWKYSWSDDCVLRGRALAQGLLLPPPSSS